MVRVKKDRSTPGKKEFWNAAEAAIQEIRSWPEWKQSYISPLLLDSKQKDSGQPTNLSEKTWKRFVFVPFLLQAHAEFGRPPQFELRNPG